MINTPFVDIIVDAFTLLLLPPLLGIRAALRSKPPAEHGGPSFSLSAIFEFASVFYFFLEKVHHTLYSLIQFLIQEMLNFPTNMLIPAWSSS